MVSDQTAPRETPGGDPEPRAGAHPAATDEADWRGWPQLERLPGLDLPAHVDRVLVVSAHPDDDVLALGGLLQRLGRHGCQPVLVCATDGEASHPDSPTVLPDELAARRTTELSTAYARLGHAGAEQVHLHLPDGRLDEHVEELADRLAPHLAGTGLAIAPWTGDGHPDHRAAGLATEAAVAELGRVARAVGGAGEGSVPVWQYPVWAWHWARPGSDALPWARARILRLSDEEQRSKAAAVREFGSQLEPIGPDPADDVVLPPEVLAHFERSYEIVFT